LAQGRLVSLDAFRGITIAGMILVNNPGSWKYVYPPLRHAAWHGWTPTDLVFPFFVFIVGCSISLALSRRIGEGAGRSDLYRKIFKRSAIIFFLGILLHLIPRFNFAAMRIPGVLQRIALCYLFAALLYIHSGVKGRAVAVVIILASYWLVMKLVPVPGHGAGGLDLQGNLCSFIDTKVLAGHLYKPQFDPEGILSTFPAVATAVLGTLAGDWLRTSKKGFAKASGLAVAGAALTVLGLVLHPYFPINKQLWTSTFVLFSAGTALLLLAGCYFLIDVLGLKTWAIPFLVFGTNAIVAFVASGLVVKLLLLVKVSSGGEKVGLLSFIYERVFAVWAGNFGGSLAYAAAYLLIWLAVLSPLYRKKIFIKI
jgi:predicted acyltransferase